ncbi:hypothetical protein Ple7327_2878 [Pleurocapsa sp. PCC 7327]|uniref:hypothetical protein n=1 Tax=Pleurocapsa sp. PCC 7327 TaxID=118163 RepID=UPI00029FFEB5|nr:hypothetical protein [Pleurocapsa sp. PCC 7327]AFY78132.1 hypothetical protein Ple7327_2878 [Pleurocapsa sp. PCC 7327]
MQLIDQISQNSAEKKNNNLFVLWLTSLFFFFGLVGILNHAMWRDELNVWLITRDSISLVELFQNIKYEGHPSLWYICLYIISQFTDNPVAMQIFHLLIATTTIYIFAKYSPFTQFQKILFSFGYFPFYEYLLISRNYAIGVLFIFLFCALFPSKEIGYIFLSAILALMANTNAYCLLISVALGLTLIVDYITIKKSDRNFTIQASNIIASILIFVWGIIVSLLTIIPPADSNLQGGLNRWVLQFDLHRLTQAISRIWNGYIIVLISGDSQRLSLFCFSLVTLFIVAFVSTILIRKPLILFFYITSTLIILFFNYIKFLGVPRHYGHHYIILLASLWLAGYYPPSNLLTKKIKKISLDLQKRTINWMQFVRKRKKIFIAIVLYTQLAGGLVAFSRDLQVPYSAGRETANYIKSHSLDQMFIVGSRDVNMAPISGYLNRKIYYPERQRLGSFTLFNSQRKDVDPSIVLEQVSQLVRENNPEILLILNYDLEKSRDDIIVSPIASFTKSLVSDEKYYLYNVKANSKKTK